MRHKAIIISQLELLTYMALCIIIFVSALVGQYKLAATLSSVLFCSMLFNLAILYDETASHDELVIVDKRELRKNAPIIYISYTDYDDSESEW